MKVAVPLRFGSVEKPNDVILEPVLVEVFCSITVTVPLTWLYVKIAVAVFPASLPT